MNALGRLVLSWVVIAIGVAAASSLVPHIHYNEPMDLFWTVIVMGLLNAIVRPILVFFTFPFIAITLGLGLFVINAFLFWLTSEWVDGFHVGTWWSALLGSVIVSLTTVVVGSLFGGKKKG